MTPPPTVNHEEMAARLNRVLDPFVATHQLDYVFHPRAVVQFQDSQAEPYLMVRPSHPDPAAGWAAWPMPFLVIEIISPATRRRDQEQEKTFYMEAGVAEYWIVDAEARSVRVVRPGVPDRVERERVAWRPPGVDDALTVSMEDVFGANLIE